MSSQVPYGPYTGDRDKDWELQLFFQSLVSTDRALTNSVGADNGNAAATLTVGTSSKTQRWSTTLTADRAVTLSTTGAVNGSKFRIVRTGAGAFNLNVGTGPLKALAASTWCDVEYDGTAWFLSAYGSL